MNPDIAEIFPILLKKLPKQSDILDYRWFLHKIEDPVGFIVADPLYVKAEQDLLNALESSDIDFSNVGGFPLPFEKFIYVAKLHAPEIDIPLCYQAFKFQRENDSLSCHHFVIEKRPVGFSCKPVVTTDFTYIELKTFDCYFEVTPSPGSSWTKEALERIVSTDPNEAKTEGERLSGLSRFALICSTYGMFGPVSDTVHYYSTTNPDPARNAQKIARGNRPKFEWLSSVIKPRPMAPAITLHRGGTHASPKPHERRAHFRRLKSGKSVLVRSTIINREKMGERGFVFHDYELKAPQTP